MTHIPTNKTAQTENVLNVFFQLFFLLLQIRSSLILLSCVGISITNYCKIPNWRDRIRQGWGNLWIITFQAKRIRCVWGKTAFSGIHTSCGKIFRSKFKASCVVGGVGSPTSKILIWWKSGQNPLKSGQNLCKFGQNMWKPSQNCLCALILQKWHPKSKCRRFLFFWEVMFLQFFFGQVRENLGKNGAWSALIWKKCAQNGM